MITMQKSAAPVKNRTTQGGRVPGVIAYSEKRRELSSTRRYSHEKTCFVRLRLPSKPPVFTRWTFEKFPRIIPWSASISNRGFRAGGQWSSLANPSRLGVCWRMCTGGESMSDTPPQDAWPATPGSLPAQAGLPLSCPGPGEFPRRTAVHYCLQPHEFLGHPGH
jgi:hypothetical protein